MTSSEVEPTPVTTEWSDLVERARVRVAAGDGIMAALQTEACPRYGGIPDVVLNAFATVMAPYEAPPAKIGERLHWEHKLIMETEILQVDERSELVDILAEVRDELARADE
jgi:hypothetical protein